MDAKTLDTRLVDQIIYRASQEERLAIAKKAIEALAYGAASRGEGLEQVEQWAKELERLGAQLRGVATPLRNAVPWPAGFREQFEFALLASDGEEDGEN